MNETTIILVEDDPDIRSLLVDFLGREGYRIYAVSGGHALDQQLALDTPHLIILDLMLPGEDGLSICRRLRSHSSIPILMLTAKSEDIDRIIGLELGADDYLGKPFNPRELLARIRAIIRRSTMAANEFAEGRKRKAFGGLVMDFDARTIAEEAGAKISLTTAEFDLLACFVKRPHRVLSRDQLLDWTRQKNADPFDRTVDVTLSRLRAKLAQQAPPVSDAIRTVRNVGYLFALDVKDS